MNLERLCKYGCIVLFGLAIAAVASQVYPLNLLLEKGTRGMLSLQSKWMGESSNFVLWMSSMTASMLLFIGGYCTAFTALLSLVLEALNREWLPEENAYITQLQIVNAWLSLVLLSFATFFIVSLNVG